MPEDLGLVRIMTVRASRRLKVAANNTGMPCVKCLSSVDTTKDLPRCLLSVKLQSQLSVFSPSKFHSQMTYAVISVLFGYRDERRFFSAP